MCHQIFSNEDIYFFKRDEFFIGVKEFRISRNKLCPVYIHNYKYPIAKEEEFYCLLNEIKTQEVNFHLLCDALKTGSSLYNVTITANINAGIHLSAFIKNRTRIFWIWKTSCQIPVMFKKQDILFWDGRDISVNKIYLPGISEMNEILKKKDAYLFDNNDMNGEKFIAKYNKILSLVKNQLESKKKKQ